MENRQNKTRELRQLAESIVQNLSEEPGFAPFDTEGLATSLVRQWLTYDSHAALHTGGDLYYLSLIRSPLGSFSVKTQPNHNNWLQTLEEDWNLSPEDFPGMIDQLNRGQSAEGINRNGEEIRWWVNPKEKNSGVEYQDPHKKPVVPPDRKDCLKRVVATLERAFSGGIPPKEIPILAQSVMDQWDRFDGRAALFNEEVKLAFLLEKNPDGGYSITTGEVKFYTRQRLEDLGISPGDVITAIARINLGQAFSFVDPNGESADFWVDPQEARFVKRIREKPKPEAFPPILCPSCGAILDLWQGNQTQQKCRLCARVVKRHP